MKKAIIALLIGLTLALATFFLFEQVSSNQSVSNPQKEIPKENYETQEIKSQTRISPIITNPHLLVIPKLGITTSIEHVGLDNQRRMDVPKDFQNVAWYELGFEPGQDGSAVIAGHYDTPNGSPGVFYDLHTLEEGDEIIVKENGKSLTFKVTHTEIYPFDQIPLEEIFNSTDKKRLNLITCDGIFDTSTQNYSSRYVVYTVLSE